LRDDVASVYLVLTFVLSSELESPPGSGSSSSFSTAQLSGGVHIGPAGASLDVSVSSCAIKGDRFIGETFRMSLIPFRLLIGEVEENGLLNMTLEDKGGDGGG
jgi:hypothetical protein